MSKLDNLVKKARAVAAQAQEDAVATEAKREQERLQRFEDSAAAFVKNDLPKKLKEAITNKQMRIRISSADDRYLLDDGTAASVMAQHIEKVTGLACTTCVEADCEYGDDHFSQMWQVYIELDEPVQTVVA